MKLSIYLAMFLILSISIMTSVNAQESGLILTNSNNQINASNIATDGNNIFINTWGKYRTDPLIYGSKINGALELHTPIKFDTNLQTYSDYSSGLIGYDNYGTYPVDTINGGRLIGYEPSYIKTPTFEYMIHKTNVFGYDDIELYYKNSTVGWTKITTPFQGYTVAGSGKTNLYLGSTHLGNDYYIAFAYSSGAFENFTIYNLSGFTTMQKMVNSTIQRGSIGAINTFSKLRTSSNDSTYLIFDTYKYDPANPQLVNIAMNCVDSLAWYDTTDDVIYEVCNGNIYKALLSTNNVSGTSLNINTFISCSSLNTLNPILKNIDCINSTNCMIGGKYLFNTDYYSYLNLFLGNGCVDVFSNNFNDTANASVTSIAHIGSTYYYGGMNIFGYYGFNPSLNVTPIKSCIDGNTMCNNSIRVQGEYQCYNADKINCAQGCFDYGNNNVVCNNACTNECNVIGATQCNDTTIVSKCDDWNSDGCYEYRPYLTCATGQFCLNSGNYLGSCVNTTQSGTHGLYGLSVIPYSTSTQGNVTYVNNQATRTLEVSTTYVIHQQDFYTSGTNYISRTCDYSEPVILSTGYALVQNYGNDSVQYLPSATSSDTIIRLSFTPSNYSEGWIDIRDTLDSVDSKIYYQRNSSAKRLTIYDSSLNIIYADYSTNTFDDLESVDLEYSFSFSTKTYTIKMLFNRVVDNIVITNPQTFLGVNIYKVNVSQFTNASDTIINQLVITNPTPYNTFTSNLGGTTTIVIINPNCNCGTITCAEYEAIYGHQAYLNLCQVNQTIPNFVQSCDYSTKGSRLVRTYGNNLGTPDYSTYVDYTIVVNGLGLTPSEVDNRNPSINAVNGQGKGLPIFWKYIIIAVTIMIIYGLGLVIGNQIDTIKIGVIVSTVLSFFALIVFTLLEWISGWIIVAMIVFGIAIVIILGSVKATSGGT